MVHRPHPFFAAVAIIDHGLAGTVNRQLVSSDEVSDLLLDLRAALVLEREALGCASASGTGSDT